ncbi:hypothetical protein [Jannaschia sp. LMIT008]|uniref:hypothetical protein n=1 Tax=Jannaschia maritima TaxID=3032585 RepID=UPI0028114E56|nr:hypothetical protein [Jannaschia sp. LMIT008]
MSIRRSIAAAALVLASSQAAKADTVYVIGGVSASPEGETSAQVTANVAALERARGNAVQIFADAPADVTLADTVWDLRFYDRRGLTGSYLSYLQGGGSLILVGENSFYAGRNDAIFGLVAQAGGGDLSYSWAPDVQTLAPEVAGGAAGATVALTGAGGTFTPGTGRFLTTSLWGGSAIAWRPGDLTNAGAGRLTAIFDANVLEGDRGPGAQAFAGSVIDFVASAPASDLGAPVDVVDIVPTPGPATLPLLAAALGAAALVRRRRRLTV